MKTIAEQHIDFVLKTKKRITYYKYYKYRVYNKLTDEEILNSNVTRWGNRYSDVKTISSFYREAVKKWFNKSFSYFYKYRDEFILDWKLNFSPKM